MVEKKISLQNLFGRAARQVRPRPRAEEPPLRAELLSVDQLARHAAAISGQQKVVRKEGSNRLLARLDENEKILRAYARATLEVDQSRRITPAAEWLLDNYYLIEEQIQLTRRHLPRNYSRELPRLLEGPSAGLPRVYDLVLELIAHVDAQIDIGHLSAFVKAFQAAAPLSLGELWAIPIMLRLGLIENLRRMTNRLNADRHDRDAADQWADRLQHMAETDPANLIVVVADLARANPPLTSAFVAQFCQRLARLDPAVHFARNWLEQRLAEHGLSIEQRIVMESQTQAADQVSVSHSITSLRSLGAFDWREFVESISVVDQALRGDPAEVYARMDFRTRDRYRHNVERIARHGNRTELEVARKAIQLAQQSALARGHSDRSAHVGYYLIDKGRPQLERWAKVHLALGTLVERAVLRFPLFAYAGGILLLMGVPAFALAEHGVALGLAGWQWWLISLLSLFCLSQLAVSAVNWLITIVVQPRLLPRLDFFKDIPADCRTMVIVPTMLTSPDGVDRLLESLEIHYLANRDEHLHFALLTDFRDAPQETMTGDEALLQRARAGINALNQKYHADRSDAFHLFHRPRRWNAAEGVWMGYERKRGKITEFNALLRGKGRDRFSEIIGDESILPEIRYVITLDTDTQLPRDAARRACGHDCPCAEPAAI